MELPIYTLILGPDPLAEALCRMFRLFEVRCYKHRAIPQDALEDEKALFLDHLRRCTLVVAHFHSGSGATEAIHFIHRLRTSLSWEGGFVAIVENAAQKTKLMEASIAGRKDGALPFARVPGHVAIKQPLLMGELLEAVSTLEEMYHEAWRGLSKSTDDLLNKLREAEAFIEAHRTQEAIQMTRALLNELDAFDWLVLLRNEHKDYRLIELLKEEYPRAAPLDVADCPAIIERVYEILSRSCIGTDL